MTGESVSRETPPAPDLAAGVFRDALETAERYAALLASEGVVRGLIGPREAPRLWERHLVNCALLGGAISPGADVCDIGSGAGLPGLVLAIARPDLTVTLVEPLLRRTAFLDEVVAALGLTNVEVVRSRAEELHGRREFGVVTSRAVAPLDRLARWSLPVTREGGAMVVMKGASVHEEVESARALLEKLGAGRISVEEYGVGLIDPPTTVLRVEATAPSRLGWETTHRAAPRSASRASRNSGSASRRPRRKER